MVFDRSGDMFDDFDREFREMNRLMDRMMQQMRGWDWDEMPAGQPLYYGVSVNVGPDGVPHVQQFGNMHPTKGSALPVPEGTREPFVTSFLDEPNNQVRVTAEMPGIDKKRIKLAATQTQLMIRAEGDDRRYEKTMPLDVAVNPDTAKARYNNGVLEVTLDMAKPASHQGKDVKID